MIIGELLKGEFLTDSLVITSHVLGKDKAWVLAHLDDSIDSAAANRIRELIDKRKNGYPLAYIINKKEFMGLDFYVEEGVFIPRPETETLVEIAIEYIKSHGIKTVAEVGCGSGAISVSIAYYCKTRIYATDISERAIRVTMANAKKYGVDDFVSIKHGEFLDPFKDEFSNIELVVSNPPYVEPEYKLPRESHYEPKEAFFYGNSSLSFYKEFKKRYANANWVLIMEFSGKEEDKKQLKSTFHNIKFVNDIDGVERFFIAEITDEA